MSETETWLAVPGYEGLYEISDRYRVRRLPRMTAHGQHGTSRSLQTKILRTSRNKGYLVAYLGGNGKTGKNAQKLYVEAAVEHLFGIKPKLLDEMSLAGEEWKDIPGYEGIYQVSTFGRIRSTGRYVGNNCTNHVNIGTKKRYIRPRLLTGNVGTPGYPKVELAVRGKIKTMSVHRLVALTFIPNPDNLPIVHHKDENKLNNRVENLEWATAATNIGDWFDRRRIVVSTDTIERIAEAIAAGKSPAEILTSLPRRRKRTKNGLGV